MKKITVPVPAKIIIWNFQAVNLLNDYMLKKNLRKPNRKKLRDFNSFFALCNTVRSETERAFSKMPIMCYEALRGIGNPTNLFKD